MTLTGGKRKVNKSLKAWVVFVKKVQKEERLSYKDAIKRAKQRKDKGEKWMTGGESLKKNTEMEIEEKNDDKKKSPTDEEENDDKKKSQTDEEDNETEIEPAEEDDAEEDYAEEDDDNGDDDRRYDNLADADNDARRRFYGDYGGKRKTQKKRGNKRKTMKKSHKKRRATRRRGSRRR